MFLRSLVAVFYVGVAVVGYAFATDNTLQEAKGLTKDQMQLRARQVKNVSYELYFELSKDQPEFNGTVKIQFKLLSTRDPLRIDFQGGKVLSVTDHANHFIKYDYNDRYISISKDQLSGELSEINIAFTHPYSNSGSGLHRFKDPEDGRVYAFTDFEPFDANKLFPCFDQPNLKASYKLKVKAPREWAVITSVIENHVKDLKNGFKEWTFLESARFSTYIFSLHAGSYHSWQDQAGDIPLRLFARQSLAKYVKPQEWFSVTKQGFQFYSNYFNYKYPFRKYDQIIVPEFNSGAMENVASVTFSERYIKRSKPTLKDLEDKASVILHEMAHMWFGDLVTMEWWDDLWLNESFATYMAALAMEKNTEFKQSWLRFFTDMKQWAYWEDQLVTTHPVTTDVKDTDQAFANFDGITYGKGASVLKQLHYYIGEENFRKGLQHYFKTYAYQNAELKHFISALEGAYGKSLDGFVKDWLKAPGLNAVAVEYACNDNKLSELVIKQSADRNSDLLRTHRSQLGFFVKQNKTLTKTRSLAISYNQPETKLTKSTDLPCPQLIYPNDQDYDFVKVGFDKATLLTLRDEVQHIKDPLTRLMIWQNLWEMVIDAKLRLKEYSDLALMNLADEQEFAILDFVLSHLPDLLHYHPNESKPEQQARLTFLKRWEEFVWQKLEQSTAGTDLQKLWLDNYVKTAESPDALNKLHALLAKRIKLPNFVIDQDRRWSMIVRLNQFAAKDAGKLTKQERNIDKSSLGKEKAIAAEVIRPDVEAKKQWFLEFLSTTPKYSFSERRAAMNHIFPSSQVNLKTEFKEAFYQSLPKLVGVLETHVVERFVSKLVPVGCNDLSAQDLKKYIGSNDSFPVTVMKELKVALQEDQRCIEIRKLESEQLKTTH